MNITREKANTQSNILSVWKRSGLVLFNPDLILAQLKGKEKKKYPGPENIPIQPIEFQREVASSGSRPVTPQFVTITYGMRTMRIPVHNVTNTVTDWIDKLGTDIP
jgi:hypothetical protein